MFRCGLYAFYHVEGKAVAGTLLADDGAQFVEVAEHLFALRTSHENRLQFGGGLSRSNFALTNSQTTSRFMLILTSDTHGIFKT